MSRRLVFSFIFVFAYSFSSWGTWPQEVYNGAHSYRDLGSEFYVEVPMVSVGDQSRLILFNQNVGKSLGLDDVGVEFLKSQLPKYFGWIVDTTGKSQKTMIATRYQDSRTKNPGDALGDGRAVWSGEQIIPLPSGEVIYLDFVLKGVGQTPLAWTNHPDPLHNDGFQSDEEAVHSFIYSEVNRQNGIDSTVDLAVIELPFYRQRKGGLGQTKTAVTVRVGSQIRLANLRYFVDQPRLFAKLFEFIIRRDLRLPADELIKPKHVTKYLDNFVRNLAHDASKYFDLHAVHRSPTLGNRTTEGGTIDMGTFRYLDAHHSDYAYLRGELTLGGSHSQTDQLYDYIPLLLSYIANAKYPLPHGYPETKKKFKRDFFGYFKRFSVNLILRRLGIPDSQAEKIPEDLKNELINIVQKVFEAKGNRRVPSVTGPIFPAAFETRKLFAESLAVLLKKKSAQPLGWINAFNTERDWGSDGAGLHADLVKKYIRAVEKIVDSMAPSEKELRFWVKNAQANNRQLRRPPGPNFYEGDEKYLDESEVLDAISKGEPFEVINNLAHKAIESLAEARGIRFKQGEPAQAGILAQLAASSAVMKLPSILDCRELL
ncbi:MAG: YdiU family protein [Bdellovibrionaceae bacterium]|nr:YdiU family protein [Pseudobdellovibrionaceae bacterium]